MPEFLTTGCLLKCSFGAVPGVFQTFPLPGKPVIMGMPAATMMDIAPVVNVPLFGMCNSLANPMVAAATTAALGVLTPMPCLPVIPAPWAPTSVIASYSGMPLATVSSMCVCTWGGQISVELASEMIAKVDS